MDATLRSALATPGRITNIWGKSGAGKTSLALDLAFSEIEDGRGKVIYITDDPAAVASRLGTRLRSEGDASHLDAHIREYLILIRIQAFKNQGNIIQQLPLAFLPDKATREASQFKNFVGTGENDLSELVIESLKAYKEPSMVIVDEITRLYKRQSIDADDPGSLNFQLLAQLGFLKNLAAGRGIKVIVTSATRTISVAVDSSDEARFIDVPVANDVMEHYVDIDAHMQWTRRPGERDVIVMDASQKTRQQVHVIDLNMLHNRLAGGKTP